MQSTRVWCSFQSTILFVILIAVALITGMLAVLTAFVVPRVAWADDCDCPDAPVNGSVFSFAEFQKYMFPPPNCPAICCCFNNEIVGEDIVSQGTSAGCQCDIPFTYHDCYQTWSDRVRTWQWHVYPDKKFPSGSETIDVPTEYRMVRCFCLEGWNPPVSVDDIYCWPSEYEWGKVAMLPFGCIDC